MMLHIPLTRLILTDLPALESYTTLRLADRHIREAHLAAGVRAYLELSDRYQHCTRTELPSQFAAVERAVRAVMRSMVTP